MPFWQVQRAVCGENNICSYVPLSAHCAALVALYAQRNGLAGAGNGEQEMATIRIVRSASTGKYHRSYEGANITSCNASGQVRIPRLVTATERELERARADSFCRKCFPNGAPGSA